MALPERIRLSLVDDTRDLIPISIPSARMWPVGLVFGAVFALFAAIAFTQVRSISFGDVESIFDLSLALFTGFWVLGWSVGVMIFFLLTVLFLLYGESARIRGDRLIHVPRLGPLKILIEYDLARVRNLRVEPSNAPGRGRIRFDYGGGDHGIGNDLPLDAAEERIRTIQSAIDALRDSAAATAAPIHVRERDDDLPGIDVLRWLPPGRRKRREEEDAATEPRSANEAPAEPQAGDEPSEPIPLTSRSGMALLAANLIPLAGIVFLGWDLGEIMVLFWSENAVIGFYNLLKLAVVTRWAVIFVGPFFLGHFGGFMAVHFLFVYYMFVRGIDSVGTEGPVLESLGELFIPLWPALLALLVSHGISFATNFLSRREHAGRSASDQMSEPYKRVIVLHVTIIFGGWLILLLGSPLPALILLIILKTAVDLRAHRQEHSGPAPHFTRAIGKKTRKPMTRRTGAKASEPWIRR